MRMALIVSGLALLSTALAGCVSEDAYYDARPAGYYSPPAYADYDYTYYDYGSQPHHHRHEDHDRHDQDHHRDRDNHGGRQRDRD